jgi:hypothetical protein
VTRERDEVLGRRSFYHEGLVITMAHEIVVFAPKAKTAGRDKELDASVRPSIDQPVHLAGDDTPCFEASHHG